MTHPTAAYAPTLRQLSSRSDFPLLMMSWEMKQPRPEVKALQQTRRRHQGRRHMDDVTRNDVTRHHGRCRQGQHTGQRHVGQCYAGHRRCHKDGVVKDGIVIKGGVVHTRTIATVCRTAPCSIFGDTLNTPTSPTRAFTDTHAH